MKKLLLATTAVAGFAMFATPAMADGLQLELGGFYRGYGVFMDNDEAAGTSLREFDLRDDAEVHFSGETTLDNGLTVGAHGELEIAENTSSNTADEIYAYFSGSWGRVNFGHEDGAAYLLQVATPSADSNVDGLRVRVQGLSNETGLAVLDAFEGPNGGIDYANDVGRNVTKLTYMTPKFSGFQGGVSFAPAVDDGILSVGNGTAPAATDDDGDEFENLWEIAARWDGEFEGVGLSAGLGYTKMSLEDKATSVAFDDDYDAWDAGLTASMAGFSAGVAYFNSNNGISTEGDSDVWNFGLGYDNGPYHLGVSYYMGEQELGAATSDVDYDRLTFGGTYTYGPGMTFRGAVSLAEIDPSAATGGRDQDVTQITIGTEVSF